MVKRIRPPPHLHLVPPSHAKSTPTPYRSMTPTPMPKPPLRGTLQLADALEAFLAERPALVDLPLRVALYALLDVRPRLARDLIDQYADAPAATSLGDLVRHARALPPMETPGLLVALRQMKLCWPIPISRTMAELRSALMAEKALRPLLGQRWVHVAERAFGILPRNAVPANLAITFEQAAGIEKHFGLVAALVRVQGAVTAALSAPLAWPRLIDDDAPLAAPRRALLAALAPRRGDRETPFRWHATHWHRMGDLTVLITVNNGRDQLSVVLDPHSGDHEHPERMVDPEALAAAHGFLYDIVNEPKGEDERAFLAEWLRPRHDDVLLALRALVAPRTPARADERIAWEIGSNLGHVPICRRQRPKANGKGFVKGTEVGVLALLADESSCVSEQDRRVAGLLSGARADIGAALRALAGHPYLFARGGAPIALVDSAVTVALSDDADGGVRVTFRLGETSIAPDQVRAPALLSFDQQEGPEEEGVTSTVRIGAVSQTLHALARAVTRTPVVPAAARPQLEALADEIVGQSTSVSLSPSLQGEVRAATPRLVLRLALGDPCRLSARIVVIAGVGAAPATPGEGAVVTLALVDGVRVRYQRDLEHERELAAPLRERLAADLQLVAVDDPWDIVADDDDALRLLAVAERSDVEVVWRDQRRLLVMKAIQPQGLKVRVSSVRQWLGLDGTVDVDGEPVSLASLLAATRAHRRFIRLGPDRFASISDELREGLRPVAALTTDDSGNEQGVVEVPFAVAHALEALSSSGVEFEEGEVWRTLAARLDRARAVDDVPPGGLTAELRPYQREGLLFLRRLAAFGTGGVLADDMGLGKTVQAIGLLVDRGDEGAAVVVVPTSLVFNWLRELERFAPSLRAHVYGHADDRAALLATMSKRDVLIVSYGLLDDTFAGTSFATAIFDEAQAIKNAETLRARACRDLPAGIKIALSGTPLENHLGELWSLFRIVCPGLLGSMEQFRKRFLLPIERDRSVQHRRQLGQTLRPFLLRRTKAEVLPDLPPLTHQLVDVDGLPDEKAIYDALRVEILDDIDDGSNVADRRFRVLAGLTRLRLCCCHPVLVEPGYRGSSAKLDEAVATLERVKGAGHKALVFSQFVKFLDLVEPALVKAGLRILRLDGSTPEAQRRARVDAFQRGEADVFLLSLKAGGAGLNLTAADVVVHLDPWWNPAVEAQAVARAHRMGRADPVTAIRIVVRGTIEEAILRLHDDKRELVDAVLAGAGGGQALSLDEIAALLTRSG